MVHVSAETGTYSLTYLYQYLSVTNELKVQVYGVIHSFLSNRLAIGRGNFHKIIRLGCNAGAL